MRLHVIPPPGQGFSFGYAVAAIPDLNADGIDDYAISRAARVYIYDGATGNVLYFVVSRYPFTGEPFGYTVIGLDDIDGDGHGDLAVGSPREYHEKQRYAGHVHVFSGATGAFIRVLYHTLPNQRYLGYSLARVPDTDGDGLNDIIAGAPYEYNGSHPESNAGRAFIFSGATGAILHQIESPHRQWNGQFGLSVGGAPDIDGDGAGDIVVGAPYETPLKGCPGSDLCGAAYILSGATGRPIRELISPMAQATSRFGWSVAGIESGPPPGKRGRVLVHANEYPNGRAYLFYTCPADFNGSGNTDSADFFLFLQRFFQNAPNADFNGDDTIDSRDFFDYLADFLGGCDE